MRKVLLPGLILVLASVIISSCNTLKSIQTNTTGGLFSLNGTWQLSSTSDNNALVGTTITVYPVVGNAAVKSIANNTYCIREKDQLWKSIKSNDAGGFTLSTLVSACKGTAMYNAGTISVVNDNKVTVTTRTATNSELIQAWDRVK